MKSFILPLLSIAAGLGLSGCDTSKKQSSVPAADPAQAKADATPPAATPGPDVRAALEAQAIGSKLLGNTVRLTGDSFKPADLQIAPEAYFVYYSASW